VRALAVQSDGSTIIGGVFTNVSGVGRVYLARLDTNAAVDLAFVPQLNAEARTIQTLPDGKLLVSGLFTNVTGVFRPGLARLLADGSLDSSFAPPKPQGADNLMPGLAAPGGWVWAAGTFTNLGGLPCNRIAYLRDNGSLDPAFHSPFTPSNTLSLLAVQADGRAIVSGSFSNVAGFSVTNLVRLNTNGTPDASFRSGLAPNQAISRALLQPDGRLLASVSVVGDYGIPMSSPQLVRLNSDGSIDPNFNASFEFTGYTYSAALTYLALQPDGKILVAGTFLRANGTSRGKLARLMPDGTLDYCFDVALSAEWTPLAVAAGVDGGIIVGGSFSGLQGQFHPYLLRLLPSVACEPGVVEMAVSALAARKDAARLVVPVVRQGGADLEQTVQVSTRDGSAQAGVDYDAVSNTVRFARGERSQFISIPLRFGTSQGVPRTFEVSLSQPGGGATLGAQTNVVVTLADSPPGTAGAPDTNYLAQLDGPVQVILPLADGRAVIAGTFTNVSGQNCPTIARLQTDGMRDAGFSRAQALDGDVSAAVLDRDGRLLVAGDFQHVDGIWRPGLARFETNGALDVSFGPFDAWPSNSIYGSAQMYSVTILTDGSIVCGGSVPLSETGYDSLDTVFKVSPAGQIDATFANHMPPEALAEKLKGSPDGGLFQIGTGFGNALTSLHQDGTLDFGFIPPADHQFAYYSYAGMDLLPDGRVAVAGMDGLSFGLASLPPLWRLNPDGSVDTGFSVSNVDSSWGALQGVDTFSAAPDGRVVVAGSFSNINNSSLTLRRLQADGSSDFSFDPGTGLKPSADGSATVNALVPLSAGGWLVGGDFGGFDMQNQRYLVKLLPETLTRPNTFTFTATNLSIVESATTLPLEVRRSGDASGSASVEVRTVDGTATAGQDYQSLDTTLFFGSGEWSKTVAVAILDNRLVEGSKQFRVVLTNASGGFSLASPSNVTVTIQNTYAGVEFIADTFQGLEEDGFVMAGVRWSGVFSTNCVAQVNIVPVIGNSNDLGISSALVQYGAAPHAGVTNWFRIPVIDDAQHEPTRQFRLELAASGTVIPGPRAQATLLIDDLDYASSPARGVAGVVEAMANAPGGGVYLAGDFTGVHGVARWRVARLLPDGQVDTAFDPGAGPNANVTAIAVQPDGKVLIAGNFTAVGGVARAGVARLDMNGALDLAFDPGLGPKQTNGTFFIRALLPQNDGGVYVGGGFTQFNSRVSRALARLQTNGSVDTGFVSPFADATLSWPSPPLPKTSAIYALAAQPDGKLLAGGILYVSPNSTQYTLVRLAQNGAVDVGFPKATGAAQSLALTTNGGILVGGTSTTSWAPISRLINDGAIDVGFQVRNLPTVSFYSSEIRQLLVQPDGGVLFCSAIYILNRSDPLSRTPVLDRAIIGRLLPTGAWDSSFQPLTCALPMVQQTGPFWFNTPPGLFLNLTPQQPVPAAFLARQPDGVLVLAGAFDSINGQPRRRLARVDPDGSLRGRPILQLSGRTSLQLVVPAEVEIPYAIETSTDLTHWSGWLANDYPWWPVELWLSPDEPARFFRTRSTP
jgi:uncharacterized delta-60 repeat protein